MRPYNPETDSIPSPPSQIEDDPELVLLDMRQEARDAARDLIPVLYEKAINGKTKDAVTIFEALADRSDFHRPLQTPGSAAPVQILNITAPEVAGLLTGLKTITSTGEDQ